MVKIILSLQKKDKINDLNMTEYYYYCLLFGKYKNGDSKSLHKYHVLRTIYVYTFSKNNICNLHMITIMQNLNSTNSNGG